MNDYDVIRREQNKAIPKYPEGTIIAVNVLVALVQRMGSSQLIPCAYDPQQGVAVGKRCAYRWVPGRNKYVIQSVYGAPQMLVSPDQNPSAFELSPPTTVVASNALPGCVLIQWNVPIQRVVAFEVQTNSSATESGATSYFTRGGEITIPAGAELFFRVRSVTTDWQTSSWTAWDSENPGAGGGGGFTEEQIEDIVNGLLVAGTGITLTYNDGANTLTIDSASGFTEEQIEDIVAGALVAGNNIDITYDDGANTITIAVETLTSADITDFSEAVDDRVGALMVAGNNIDLNYDDGANTLTVAVETLTASDISDFAEAVDDRVAALIVAGNNIDVTYVDGSNTLTIDVEALTSADITDFNEAVDDRVDALLVEGTGITLTYDDIANTLTVASSAGGLVEEDVEDIIAGALVAGNNIDITYNDGSNTITIDVETLTAADVSDFSEAVDDRVNALLVEGTGIDLTYNDGSNTLTITATGGGGGISPLGHSDPFLVLAADSDNLLLDGGDLVVRAADTSFYPSRWQPFGASTAPLWVDNAINSEPTFRFDGTDQGIAKGIWSNHFRKGMLAIVIKPLDDETESGIFSWADSLVDGSAWIIIQRDGTDVVFYQLAYNFTIAHAIDDVHVYVMGWDGTNAYLTVDGVPETPVAAILGDPRSYMFLGSGYNGFTNVEVPELRLYDWLGTNTEMAAISAELETKYGV